MLPKKSQQDVSSETKDLQSNLTTSSLNVNAVEFVPSTSVSGKDSTNSALPLSVAHMPHIQNLNISASESSSQTTSVQEQVFSIADQQNVYLVRDAAVPDYSHSTFPLVNHNNTQNFNIVDYDTNVGTTFPHRQEYTHSSTDNMQDYDSSSIDYVATSVFEWPEFAPSPYSEPRRCMDPEFQQRYKEAREASFLPSSNWDTSWDGVGTHPDFNDQAFGVTASCLPEDYQLIAYRKHVSENLEELMLVPPEDILREDHIIDASATHSNEDNNNIFKTYNNEKIMVEHARKTKQKTASEEEIQHVVIPKNTKKKHKFHIDEIYSEKEHVNIVFIGHVDAGKSTIGGQLMFLTGMVDKRTMEKYQKEAKQKSRDSWYISWALDTNQEERDKGKTVETGRGHFETETKHFTILDAPGHKSFVPSMILGAAQADIAVLVLSARQNEFESGFDKGGQTRDHAMLAKSAGVKVIIALVNKMDDPTVKWNEERYIYCRDKTMPFLKKLGFASKDVHFMPVSGQTGDGLMTALSKTMCPWFRGPSFIDCLDKLSPIARDIESPFVMPIVEKFKDKGTVVMGKVEAGSTHITNCLLLMPNKVMVSVDKIWSDDKEVTLVKAGENVKLKLKGIEDEEISSGFVLCDSLKPITTATLFDAQLHILNCKSIITQGFSAVMHIQSVVETVTVTHLICLVDPKTNLKSRIGKLFYVKNGDYVILRMQCAGVICLTVFKEFPKLGRFTLRDDNNAIAIGIVLKIIK